LTDHDDGAPQIQLADLFAVFVTRFGYSKALEIVRQSFALGITEFSFMARKAEELGQAASPGTPATVLLTLRRTTTASLGQTIRRGDHAFLTERAGDAAPVRFEMQPADVILPPGPPQTSISFIAVQGSAVADEFMGTADGSALQEFTTRYGIAVDGGYETVTVTPSAEGSLAEIYSRAVDNNLLRHGPSDRVYEVRWTSDWRMVILFGDNLTGKAPEGEISISYRIIPENENGNVPAGSITALSPGLPGVAVTNASAAQNYAPPDTIEDLRFRVPRAARVPYGYCVEPDSTAANVERTFTEVGRCYTVAGVRGENTLGVYLSVADGGAPSADLIARVRAFIEASNPGTERVYVYRAAYTSLAISAIVAVDSSYVSGSAEAALAANTGPLAYDADGNRSVTPGQIWQPDQLADLLKYTVTADDSGRLRLTRIPGVRSVRIVSPTAPVTAGARNLPLFTAAVTLERV